MSEDGTKKFLHNETEKAQWRKEFYKKIVQELSENESCKKYLSQYNPQSVENFIDYYANSKVSWYEHGESFSNYQKIRETEWYNYAVQALAQIQQTKLFHLCSRWYNNEIKLNNVEITFDLKLLCSAPFSCTHITKIQQHEAEHYIDFIHNLPQEEEITAALHQRMPSDSFFHKEDDENAGPDDYPLWFTCFDEHYGTAHIKFLPAPRFVKELEYKRTYWQSNSPPSTGSEPYVTPKYIYFSHRDIADAFVKKFETRNMYELYQLMQRVEHISRFADNIDSEVDCLLAAKETVPISSNNDWRNAIAAACEMYRRKKIAEAIPVVYTDYCERLSNKTGFADWETIKDADYRHKEVEAITAGRLLMGEPGDLNF